MAGKGKSLAAKVGSLLQASAADDDYTDGSDASDDDGFGRASSMERQAGFGPAARRPGSVYAAAPVQGHGSAQNARQASAELSASDKAKAIKEVEEFAAYLGMNLEEDRDLLWVAVEAMTAPLPENWSEHNTRDGQPYYYNKRTDHTQWEHPMDDYHRGLYKKLKAEKLKGKTQQQLAVTKQEADHKFAAEAARAAAEGVTGPHHRKSSIVVGNGVLAGAKDRKVPKAAAAAAAAAAGYSAGNAATVAEGEDKSASAWQKEGARAGSSEKGRQVVSVALGAAAVPSPEVGTTDSTPACSPNETQRSPPSQVDDTRHEELLAAKARKQDKKARLRSKLAAIKGVDVAAAGGGSELGSLSPEEKERLKEREQAKLRSMLELVKEHKRIGGSLNARHQPAGGQLDPLALDPAPLSRHMSLMDQGHRLSSAEPIRQEPAAAAYSVSADMIQVPLQGAKVREKIRHFEESLGAGADSARQSARAPMYSRRPAAELPAATAAAPPARASRLARPITPDEEDAR